MEQKFEIQNEDVKNNYAHFAILEQIERKTRTFETDETYNETHSQGHYDTTA